MLGLDAFDMSLVMLPAALCMVLAAPLTALSVGACAFALGTGFGTVMVTATEVLVRRAAAADAGVAGGLQQTAMNVGPTLGTAIATTLLVSGRDLTASMGPTLTVLAVLSCAGAAAASRLPRAARPLPVE
ncbi:hypothetical protein [Streptomyces sp. NPDC046939]|uniref:hypothetical protein n=1 Tax=Streptomyces sp. NPDC046939 TaxID=3155376 RepID=UPI0033CEF288